MKRFLKKTCGDIAAKLLTRKRIAIANGAPPTGAVEKLINASLIRGAATKGDYRMLRQQLNSYWQGDSAARFYETYQDRFEEDFLEEHYAVVEELGSLLNKHPDRYSKLFEIGCGNGAVLKHLASELSSIESFFGIDINEEIIQKNQQSNQAKNLVFKSGDAIEYINNNSSTGSVLFSYGGVMEYFLEPELSHMFETLKSQSPSVIALVEPLYDGFDLQSDTESKPGGLECSFSHNYPSLLEEVGFEMVYQKEISGSVNWLMVIAQG